MGPRSVRILEVLRQTIEEAERTPGLGSADPGVIQLQKILAQWTAERDAEHADQVPVDHIHLNGEGSAGAGSSHRKT